jgi:glyoxylase-like metal-dependent hydrolase (beta-lactamase superfamily II)
MPMIHRRELLRASVGAIGATFVAGRASGQTTADDSDPSTLIAKIGPAMSKIPVTTVNLATGLDVLQGPGGNVAVLRGPDSLLVVDSAIPARGQEIFDTAKKVGGKPISTLVNTHWHFDHAGGNEVFGRAGASIVATSATRKRLSTDQYTEAFKLTTPASPAVALPVMTFDEATLHVGDETLHLFAVPPAHTDGDLIIHFTAHDVIHTGDLFSNGIYPNIDASSRGWLGGMIAAADKVLKIAGPNTNIIPGHGPIGTPENLAAFRKMLVTLYDRLAPMLDAGKSTAEAIAAKPTSDLDAVYGMGFFNGAMFTRIVYDGLIKHRKDYGKTGGS